MDIIYKTHHQKFISQSLLSHRVIGKTARQEQLFLAVSVVQLSPEAKLKSDKGLQGPERKESGKRDFYSGRMEMLLTEIRKLRETGLRRSAGKE